MSDVKPSELSPERVFLHDIASHMTVIKLVLKRIKKESENPAQTLAEIAKLNGRLEQAIHAMEKLEELHARRKAAISTTKAA